MNTKEASGLDGTLFGFTMKPGERVQVGPVIVTFVESKGSKGCFQVAAPRAFRIRREAHLPKEIDVARALNDGPFVVEYPSPGGAADWCRDPLTETFRTVAEADAAIASDALGRDTEARIVNALTGEVIPGACPECEGAGELECSLCGGIGGEKSACRSCGGTGLVPCHECGEGDA